MAKVASDLFPCLIECLTHGFQGRRPEHGAVDQSTRFHPQLRVWSQSRDRVEYYAQMRYDSILSGKQRWFASVQSDGRDMPNRPKAQKHPADLTVEVIHMTTPEDRKDLPAHDGKDKAAQSLGQRGGRARAKALSARRRKEIAQKAAHALEDIGRPPKTKMVPRPRRSAQQGARGGVRKKEPG